MAEQNSIFTQMQDMQEAKSVFTAKPDTPARHEKDSVNNAQSEVLISGHSEGYDARVQNNLARRGQFDDMSTGDAVMSMIQRQIEAGHIKDFGIRDLAELSPEERNAKLLDRLGYLNWQETTNQELALVALFQESGGFVPAEVANLVEKSVSPAQWHTYQRQWREREINEIRAMVNDFAGSLSFDMDLETAMDFTAGEFFPVYNVLQKNAILQVIQKSIAHRLEGTSEVMLGSMRKEIADALGSMSDAERKEAIGEVIEALRELRNDEDYGDFIRYTSLVQVAEALFNDDVIEGRGGLKAGDYWIGQIETIGEMLWSGYVLKTGGKAIGSTWRGVFNATDKASNAARVANQVQARGVQTQISKAVQDAIGVKHSDPVSIYTSNQLPRNAEFIDARTVRLPGVADQIVRHEGIANELRLVLQGNLKKSFTAADLQNARDAAMLNYGDKAVTVPGMSVIKETDEGIEVLQVLGKAPDSGWSSFDDLLPDLMEMDPYLEKVKIMRVDDAGVLREVPMDKETFARIVAGEIKPPTLYRTRGEYYLQWENYRPYHPLDKKTYGKPGVIGSWMPEFLRPPNIKHSEDIYEAVRYSGAQAQQGRRLVDQMFDPFYRLGNKDKLRVQDVYDWTEQYGKKHGKAPDTLDILAQHPDLTPAQIKGVIALRQGYDTLHDITNYRLWREYKALDYKTARTTLRDGAIYHGKSIPARDLPTGTRALDPVTNTIRTLRKKDLEAIEKAGGGLLQVELPLTSAGGVRTKMVLIDGVDYKVGPLSRTVLKYHPGYNFRLYKNPYYVNRIERNVPIDGKVIPMMEEAIRTAGTKWDAEAFLNRIAKKEVDAAGNVKWVDDKGREYSYANARDLDNMDTIIKQKEVLHQQNRLFWDSRRADAILDVDGNPSARVDFIESIEKGASLLLRQHTGEDPLRALKNAFEHEYAMGPDRLIKGQSIRAKGVTGIIEELKIARNNAIPEMKPRIDQAIERAKYIRMMEGMDSKFVPSFRRWSLGVAQGMNEWLQRGTGKQIKWLENTAMVGNPIKFALSVPHQLFLVLRPLRQRVLQSIQPLMYFGLDPVYFATGQAWRNGSAWRVGFNSLASNSYDLGFSAKSLAKKVGMSEKEYKHVLKNMSRQGIIDVVDAHSFKEAAALSKRIGPDTGRAVGTLKSASNFSQKHGFDYGEQMNRLVSWDFALRRYKKRLNKKSYLDLDQADFDAIAKDADNLALAMHRPNASLYQQGMWKVVTQFASFTHKAALTFVGGNPAVRGMDVAKLWAGYFGLFGTDGIPAFRDEIEEFLRTNESVNATLDALPDGWGDTTLNLVTNGVLQSTASKLVDWDGSSPEQVPDLGAITPIVNIAQLFEMHFEWEARRPIASGVRFALGAFGDRVVTFTDVMGLWGNYFQSGQVQRDPVQALAEMSDLALKRMLPQYNDAAALYMALTADKYYNRAGEPLAFQPNDLNMLIRALLGVRTEGEEAHWKEREFTYSKQEMYRQWVADNQDHVRRRLVGIQDEQGNVTARELQEVLEEAAALAAWAPEGLRIQALQDIMGVFDEAPDVPTPAMLLMENLQKGYITAGEAMTVIDQIPGIDANQRSQLRQIIVDAYDDTQMGEEEVFRTLTEANRNK